MLSDSTLKNFPERPLFSFDLNNKSYSSSDVAVFTSDTSFRQVFDNKVTVIAAVSSLAGGTWKCNLTF
jgi:hypothetical protein